MSDPNVRAQEIAARLRELRSRGQPVLSSHKPNPPNVIGFPTLDRGLFTGWRTQCLAYLRNVFGDEQTYPKSFADATNQYGHTSEVEQGMAILEAAAEDVEAGYIAKVVELVTSDVSANFLEQAQHLLEAGYKDSSAMLAGAVLEDGLRRILVKSGETVKPRDDLAALNGRSGQKQLYSRLVQKKVSVWIDVRNSAAHGKFADYNVDDVERMVEGVGSFLADHLG
jgi:hypothetical protein